MAWNENPPIGLKEIGTVAAAAVWGAAAAAASGEPRSAIAGAALAGGAGQFVKAAGGVVGGLLQAQLSSRQKQRMERTFEATFVEIQRLVAEGKTPRDGLFTDDPSKSAEYELLEGCLLHGRDCYEARRKEHLDLFWGRWAMAPGISVDRAHHLFRVAQETTYRQWVMVALHRHGDKNGRISGPSHPATLDEGERNSIAAELESLWDRLRLANLRQPSGTGQGGQPLPHLGTYVSQLGMDFDWLLALDRIPTKEIDALVAALYGCMDDKGLLPKWVR